MPADRSGSSDQPAGGGCVRGKQGEVEWSPQPHGVPASWEGGGGGFRRGKGHGKASSPSSRQHAALNPAASPFMSSSLSRVQAGWLAFASTNGITGRRPPSATACAAGQETSPPGVPRLVHVQDQISNRRFLVDTGASYSIFPHSLSSPTGSLLAGPIGSEFTLYFSGRLFKGTVSPDFLLLVFFPEPVSPKPLIIPLGPFRIFSKIRWDIRTSRFATGVNDTGGKWKKPSSRKILIILFGHLWVVELTYI